MQPYEVYAVKYAEHMRRASENFIGGDAHDGPMPLDYFVWAIRGGQKTWIVDTGFSAEVGRQRGRKVLRCPSEGLKALDIDPDKVEKSLYDVLVHDMPISEIIVKREIDIAVSSIDLAGAEIAMSTKIGRERSLEKALKEVAADYDFVCIDTPPSLGLLTINALTAAHKVIVPVQCEYLSMRGLIQLQNTLSMIRENLNPNVEIEGILPTLFDTRTLHAKEAIEILEENFGDRVFASRIKKTVRFAEAPVKGMSVLKYDPDGIAAHSYRALAKEVLGNGKR